MSRFIVRDEAIRRRALSALLSESIEEPIEVVIKPYKKNRSLAQNNLLHKWMREISKGYFKATGQMYKPEVWKEYFKKMFLGEKSVEIGGKIFTYTRSTAELDVKEFTLFLDSIDHYCGSELGVMVPYTDGLYDEAMR